MRTALSLRTWRKHPFLAASVVLALGVAVFAIGLDGRAGKPPARPARALAQSTIIVAARPLQTGTIIAPDDLRARTVTGKAPVGAFLSMQDVLGRIVGRSFAAGDVLLKGNLRDPSEVGIAAQVPQGQRAFSIRVAEDEIVGGFLQSGDRVDIFATIPGSAFAARDANEFSDRSQAVLLLQNVLVLAVGENTATRGSIQAGARTVSFSLLPADLARLTLALRFGKVSLAIRKPGDTAITAPAGASLADLVGHKAPPAPVVIPATPRQRVASIPFYSGTHTTVAPWSGGP